MHPETWIEIRPEGPYVVPADAYIDPTRPVPRAIITHGHADHARAGHGTVYATPETLKIMAVRYGETFTDTRIPLAYGETIEIGGAELCFGPAGHIWGSAQAMVEHADKRIVFAGDYKRREDPTAAPFTPMACDVFVTEATFGLPVFRHPPIEDEIAKLLNSLALQGDRPHLVGAYALGKCQRVIMALRATGYQKPIYLHGALMKLATLYQENGFDFGELRPVAGVKRDQLAGEIIMCPPSALADRWSRRMGDPVTAMASGWMRVRARARQRGAELPLIISDHADWNELCLTLQEMAPADIWITHGREDALMHQAERMQIKARALSLIGYEEDASE
ncbi:MAG: ligase-associated DNA damage response exonuclease [Pseudomonadota bacterium]